MKQNYLRTFVPLLLLHFFTWCSSDSGEIVNEPIVSSLGEVNEIVIYEANPKVFSRTDALNAITARLDEIKTFGVNVVWLMPIYEEGIKNSVGSPYCVKDYRKLNADYGTLDDLRTLVKKAHEKDMRVILDWVANHTSWDNAWIQNKAWYTQDAAGNIISPDGMGWADVADLNYDNPDMRKAMLEAMKYWITEVDVDGFRCDYAEGVPHDFWKHAIDELKILKGDDLLMLAEGSASSLYEDGFDLLYGWDFASCLQEVFTGTSDLSTLYDVHKREYKDVPERKQRLRYSTNHDLASEYSPLQIYKNEKGAMAAFVIASTLGGTPLIYSSQEIGYPQALSFFDYRLMDWNSNQSYLTGYKKIMEIYCASTALRSGETKWYNTGKVASYCRLSGKERMFVVVNTTNESMTVKTPIERAGEQVESLLNGKTSVLPAVLTLEPYQYEIFKY